MSIDVNKDKDKDEGNAKHNSHYNPEMEMNMEIHVFQTRDHMGRAAGLHVESIIENLLKNQPEVRMIFAAAPSQLELLDYLRTSNNIDWGRITAFHMDEYIGLPENASQAFGHFLNKHLFSKVPLKKVHLMNTEGSREDIALEIKRYSALLTSQPIDIVCLGIGENGHLAFNDPPVADFNDPEILKIVTLDLACREQQVHDGMFASVELVPKQALTLTIPTLVQAKYLICVAPGSRKRQAVYNAIHAPVSEACPATILRSHLHCALYVDAAANGLAED